MSRRLILLWSRCCSYQNECRPRHLKDRQQLGVKVHWNVQRPSASVQLKIHKTCFVRPTLRFGRKGCKNGWCWIRTPQQKLCFTITTCSDHLPLKVRKSNSFYRMIGPGQGDPTPSGSSPSVDRRTDTSGNITFPWLPTWSVKINNLQSINHTQTLSRGKMS